ncbi:uncharacterized protein SPPG_00780 [Spizellomyces punctatus DAOM BR117]|uniref:HIT domain-containing protein n=1 Tax=Spizellomyces punctatus (strain DAOM BR117) TaxID=645134 RepID=A0A0L0HUU2_SPIPD|nr:uncharacterized protein SPPG_00780 [Spizellomyces punctatus DAOM BR117]KND05106.1 hypothetical protein SPPG_00780 [Spizellomyces punctatus DAOM BR117]|eukprot:XP_016613145.1 hypothetical protein SPPG_00780 [Spizellomyces punctatus DAOM BR117]
MLTSCSLRGAIHRNLRRHILLSLDVQSFTTTAAVARQENAKKRRKYEDLRVPTPEEELLGPQRWRDPFAEPLPPHPLALKYPPPTRLSTRHGTKRPKYEPHTNVQPPLEPWKAPISGTKVATEAKAETSTTSQIDSADKDESQASSPSWKDALKRICQSPESFNSDVVKHYDDRTVTIADLFPKAKCHFLVMPRQIINDFEDLTLEHLTVLDDLRERAEQLIASHHEQDPSLTFKCGFHALPSMRQLHLHVISTDFCSPNMFKSGQRKHWNSYNTSFFVPLETLRERLEKEGRIQFDVLQNMKKLQSKILCNVCQAQARDMRELKVHLSTRHWKQADMDWMK